MTDKQTTNTRNDPYLDVTFNIITNKADKFISCIATHRKPSANERNRCDWQYTMRRGGVRIHVIGRGDELSEIYLKQIAGAYCDGLPVWKHIDLSKPDMPILPASQSATWAELMEAAKRNR